MIRSYTMMKTGSTTGTVCHQGKRIKPDHGPTPEDHDPRKLPLAVEATGGAVVVVVAAQLAHTVPAGEVLPAARTCKIRGGTQTLPVPGRPLRPPTGLEPA